MKESLWLCAGKCTEIGANMFSPVKSWKARKMKKKKKNWKSKPWLKCRCMPPTLPRPTYTAHSFTFYSVAGATVTDGDKEFIGFRGEKGRCWCRKGDYWIKCVCVYISECVSNALLFLVVYPVGCMCVCVCVCASLCWHVCVSMYSCQMHTQLA